MSDATKLGVWQSFGLGGAWPELETQLGRLYMDRIASLPWVPTDWLTGVHILQQQNPLNLVRIGPAINALGLRSGDAPEFADSQEKIDAWQQIYLATNKAVNLYATGKLIEGQKAMAAAYADSAFWTRAYQIAVAVRDFPANAVGSILDGAQDVAGGILGKLFKSWLVWAALGIAALYVAWRTGLLKLGKR